MKVRPRASPIKKRQRAATTNSLHLPLQPTLPSKTKGLNRYLSSLQKSNQDRSAKHSRQDGSNTVRRWDDLSTQDQLNSFRGKQIQLHISELQSEAREQLLQHAYTIPEEERINLIEKVQELTERLLRAEAAIAGTCTPWTQYTKKCHWRVEPLRKSLSWAIPYSNLPYSNLPYSNLPHF
jgi:hypothetical protein